jgi:hypothetical protein
LKSFDGQRQSSRATARRHEICTAAIGARLLTRRTVDSIANIQCKRRLASPSHRFSGANAAAGPFLFLLFGGDFPG